MTILPVPLTDFRADMAKYLNMLGGVEVHVTKHGRTIAVVRKPEDARKVEDPPGGERIRLMEALLEREVEREPAPKPSPFIYVAGEVAGVGDTVFYRGEDGTERKAGVVILPPVTEDLTWDREAPIIIGADPSTGPDLTATTVYQKHDDGTVEAVDPAPFDPFGFMGGI